MKFPVTDNSALGLRLPQCETPDARAWSAKLRTRPARYASTSSPTFSNWKEHDSYRVAFDKLVKGLKASG